MHGSAPAWPARGGGFPISRIFGTIHGLKSSIRQRVEKLHRRRVPQGEVISPDLSRELARISFDSGRQIGLLLSRNGTVEMVLVGGPRSLFIPDLPKSRGGRWRLRGLRLVHTHLQAEPLTQDDLMDLVFLRLDCVAAVLVDAHGGATNLEVAHILPAREHHASGWEILPPIPCHDPHLDFQELVQSLESELERNRQALPAAKQEDRAILVSVTAADKETARISMDELVELADTSGIMAVDTIVQRQRGVNPKYLIGKGKLSEIVLRALQCGVDLLIFDQELNPSQVKAITDTTELRVIDRNQLILDIFAQRAHSREGKIQVEMAQLKYLLPRLGMKDDALSRLTGGIGARGPGETTLEVNRRRIKDRIAQLDHELDVVRKNRGQRRARRLRKALPIISIVGYTNAGKSTLLNTLTRSDVFVEDKLFATLDPTSRRLRFPRDFEVIISDTVGFIRDLPKDLLEAFAATLEELDDADLLLHVVDIGNPRFEEQMAAVQRIIEKLDLHLKPAILVFNKMDLVEPGFLENQMRRYGAVAISALDTGTLPPLILRLQDQVEELLEQGQFGAVSPVPTEVPDLSIA
ncbi:MAG: GTPase HflX [Syntrophobacteraceae bacterium]|nr:GTPase HflX [Syntrophobacteraceae bacterium]